MAVHPVPVLPQVDHKQSEPRREELSHLRGGRLELPGKVFGVDRSAWVLGEARRTWSHFGIRHHTRRADHPNGTPEGARGDAFVLGWVVNELQPQDRDELRKRLDASIDRGARVLIVEPLARAVSPWWDSWCETLDARSEIIRLRIERPAWVEDLDRASGLDHSTLGARVLYARA